MVYRQTERTRAKLADNRNRLVAAARLAVAAHGFRGAHMSAIAIDAGLATGTLYRYFPSKAALCTEVLAEVSRREVAVVGEIAHSDRPPAERLREAVTVFAARALRSRRLAYALIAEPVDAEVDVARLQYRRACVEVFADLLREGIADGSFPEQDPEASAACLVGAFIEGLVGPLAPELGADRERNGHLIESIADFCLRAVGADPRMASVKRGNGAGRVTAARRLRARPSRPARR